jgi:hypothetical protein
MLSSETFLLGIISFYAFYVVKIATEVIFWDFCEDSLASLLSLLDGAG